MTEDQKDFLANCEKIGEIFQSIRSAPGFVTITGESPWIGDYLVEVHMERDEFKNCFSECEEEWMLEVRSSDYDELSIVREHCKFFCLVPKEN